ncbi:MAG: 50S ribosomal protein L5 [Candidatus Omnitrophica bacterium]|nr:50S ribosomal protein L5 [Candidatus Omnitrophota bacterium]
MPRLLTRYRDEIVPGIMKKFNFKNRFQVPRLTKIVINIGMGEGGQDIKVLESACEEVALITGQRPVITRAKKAIANFKIRKGLPIGCKVTLRGMRMYEFLDRLTNVALPRIRDFRGVSATSFDGDGNYAIGITEQFIFPEIDYDKVQKIHGMDIIIGVTPTSRECSYELLKLLGMPFKSD